MSSLYGSLFKIKLKSNQIFVSRLKLSLTNQASALENKLVYGFHSSRAHANYNGENALTVDLLCRHSVI